MNRTVAELIRGRRAVLTVASRSMLPLLREGDELLLGPQTASDLALGQIVAFLANDQLWIHRVVEIDRPKAALTTRGDLSSLRDLPIPFIAVIGVALARRRPGRPWKRLDRGLYRAYGALQAHLGPTLAPGIPWLRQAFGRAGTLPLARVLRSVR